MIADVSTHIPNGAVFNTSSAGYHCGVLHSSLLLASDKLPAFHYFPKGCGDLDFGGGSGGGV